MTLPLFEYKSIVHSTGGKNPFCNVKDATVPGPDGTDRHLFLLMEMPVDNVFSRQLFDELFETFHTNMEAVLADHHGEDAFEAGLRALNKRLHTLSEEIDEKWFSHVRALVAFSEGTEIHLSPVGKVHAFYCTNQQVQDVLGQRPVNAKIDPQSAFSQVISGEFIPNSALVLCTDRLIEMFSPERIKRTIIEKPVDEAASLFSGIVQEDLNHPPIAALFLKPDNDALAPAIHASQETEGLSTEDSMKTLVSREENTKDLLSSGFFVSLKRAGGVVGDLSKSGLSRIRGISTRRKKDKKPSGESVPVTITTDHFPVEEVEDLSPNHSLVDSSETVQDSPFEIRGTDEQQKKKFPYLKMPARLVSSKQAVKAAMSQLKTDSSDAFRPKPAKGLKPRLVRTTARVVLFIANLSWPRRILLVLAFLLVFIFAQSVLFEGRATLSREEVQDFDQVIEQADAKMNEAKAALLYNNEEGARAFFGEARALLAQIPEDTRLYANEATPRLTAIREEEKTLNKEEDVSPTSSTPLPEGAQGLNLAFHEGALYGASTSDGTVYRLENGSWVPVAKAEHSWKTLHPSDGRLLGVLSSGEIAEMSGDQVTTVAFSAPEGLDLADAAFFSNRLYLLDRGHKQVWKLTSDGSTYGSPTEWIADEKSSLGTPKSFHIDGNIYILNEEGVLTKWFNGTRQRSFSTDVTLSNGFSAFVASESDLFLAAPGDSRIVQMQKEGGLVRQLLSAELSDIHSITLHPDGGDLFTSSGQDIDTFTR